MKIHTEPYLCGLPVHGMETGDVPLEEMLDAIEKRGIDLATLEFLDLDYDEVRELYLAVKYR